MSRLAKVSVACFVAFMLGLGCTMAQSYLRRERVCGYLFIVYISLVMLWQAVLHYRSRS